METKSLQLKVNYAATSKFESFYTGGKIQVSADGKNLFCPYGCKVQILDIATGKVERSIVQEDEEDVSCFILSPDDQVLVTSSKALLLRQWEWRNGLCTRTWKAIHRSPVTTMAFDPTSTLLATGGSDSTIKVWDVIKQYCTHNFKGFTGVVSVLAFHPDPSCLRLFSAAMDCHLRIWDLMTSSCLVTLEAHFSTITALRFTTDGSQLLSAGRDKVVIVWDIISNKQKRTIPVFESIEDVVILPQNEDFSAIGVKGAGVHFLSVGNKGLLKVWEASSSRCVFEEPIPEGGEAKERGLVQATLVPTQDQILSVTAGHNIILRDVHTLTTTRQFVGCCDDVLDVKFIGHGDDHVAVATNSMELKVYEIATGNCQILPGHSDIVMALDVFRKDLEFASSSKDNSIRIWRMNKNSGRVHCFAVGIGHTQAVGSLACSKLKEQFVVSGSQDCTMKMWKLPKTLSMKDEPSDRPVTIIPQFTFKAHDKDINSIAISPNDKLFASGSQDRTAKLWSSTGELMGILRGHRRGIWCVQFSPMDQVLATSSADGTIRLWGLQDLSCLKTFEGHETSVLRVVFVARGMQLVSSGSDGLIKVWTIKTNECNKTIDGHEDRIWGLHVNREDNQLVTGAGDSCIVLWQDVTEEEREEERTKQAEQILKQQELSNLLKEKRFSKALSFAISLDQPHTTLDVIKAILEEPSGEKDLEMSIMKLRQDQKDTLLTFCVTWNTNSRHCHEAQLILSITFRHIPPEDLLRMPAMRSTVESLLPYTERHFQRLTKLLQATKFLDYMWHHMRLTPDYRETVAQDSGMDAEDTTTSTCKGVLHTENATQSIRQWREETEVMDSDAEEEGVAVEEEMEKESNNSDDECSNRESITQVKGTSTHRHNVPVFITEDDTGEEEEVEKIGLKCKKAKVTSLTNKRLQENCS
uniref:transducin beta-like protein 3 n=1 Tax=Myxine glutinosa TaxID=7769 RepID=UPI00358F3981